MKTIHHLLCFALLVVAPIGFGADREQFTLKDGRVIVGSYDEATQTLLMESPKASLHVDLRDIVKREEAPEPKKEEKKERRAKEGGATDGGAMAIPEALREANVKMEAADAAIAAASHLRSDAEQARNLALHDFWNITADLTPILVKVPNDPTQADLQRARALTQLNEWMAEARKDRAAGKGVKWPSEGAVWSTYAKEKGAPWLERH